MTAVADTAPPTTTAILRVESVALKFGGIQALRGVSMDVREGELYGLIGPNGAGKSSLLNCISGFYRPQAGTVHIATVDVTHKRPDAIARMGLGRTFQAAHLSPDLTVLESCMVGWQLQARARLVEVALSLPRARSDEREARQAALAMLDRLQLSKFAGVRAIDLPFGLQKRVEIARALCSSPKTLLLDEPASGLNPGEVDAMANLVAEINAGGVTVLIVEHNMRFIMAICQRICVLHHGQTLAIGTPTEVQRNQAVIDAYLGARVR